MPEVYLNGLLFRKWDDDARIFTEYDKAGELVISRPYDADENTRADAEQIQAAEAVVEKSLRQEVREQIQVLRDSIGAGDSPAGTDTLNAVINTGNQTINASPAQYLKALARLQRLQTRQLIAVARILARDLTEGAPA